jgi:hypothetical protein
MPFYFGNPDERCALYLARVVTYGKDHPIKIGVSKNVPARMKQLRAMGIFFPELLGHFDFPTRREACAVEAAACRAFRPCPRYGSQSREILAATAAELISFVSARAQSGFVKAPQ